MLEALGVASGRAARVHARAEPARARPDGGGERGDGPRLRRATQIDVVDAVPDAVARALEVTPADGQVIVTGSLYTVGAARSVLVPDA